MKAYFALKIIQGHKLSVYKIRVQDFSGGGGGGGGDDVGPKLSGRKGPNSRLY